MVQGSPEPDGVKTMIPEDMEKPVARKGRHFDIIPEPEVVRVWCVHENGERHVGKMFAFALTEDEAKILAKGKGWYGGDATVREGLAVKWISCYYVMHPDTDGPVDPEKDLKVAKEELRQQALAKLNEIDKKVLDIK